MQIMNEKNIKECQSEANILNILSRNNRSIVKYYDSFIRFEPGKSSFVIVMEYIQGFTLNDYIDDLIRKKTVTKPFVVFVIAVWLFSVLDYIHNFGFVHLDIKPGNIMVDTLNKRLVLIDFGLSSPIKRIITKC